MSLRRILANTSYLSIIEIIKLVMPFVALPFIIKTIGAESYGLIVFVQTIISFFSVVINLGLDISAVKEVAENSQNYTRLGGIVSNVLTIKGFLFLVLLALLFIIGLFVGFVQEHLLLFLCCYFLCLTDVLFPVWFFQGIEEMKYITVVKSLSVILYVLLIFLFLRPSSSLVLVPLFQSLASIVSCFVAIYIVVHVKQIRLTVPKLRRSVVLVGESLPFFMSRLTVVVNQTIAKTVCGVFLTMSDVAIFDLAQKIAYAALIPLQMINQVLYPQNAKRKEVQYASAWFIGIIGLTVMLCLVVYLLSPFVIHHFFPSLLESVTVIRILTVFIFMGGLSMYLGSPVLVAFGHPGSFNASVVVSTLCLLSVYVLLYFSGSFHLYSFAFSLAFAEMVIVIYRFFYVRKYNLINFKLGFQHYDRLLKHKS